MASSPPLNLAASALLVLRLILPFGSLLAPETSAMAASPSLTLQGRIERLSGNRQPGPSLPPPAAAGGQELVVVQGTLQPRQLGDPFLPADTLRAPVLGRTQSDGHGHFRLPVASTAGDNVVTVFLVVPGGYYLNAFDSEGRFASLTLPAAAGQPLVLQDDRGALF